MTTSLTQAEILRYSRHVMLPGVGLEGQEKLKAASVLVVGTGGLGSPISMYLAAAGIGHLGLADYDVVDSSNLQRQIVHGTKAVGMPKVESARDRLTDLNPFIQIDIYNEPMTLANMDRIGHDYDIIVDGTDNFPTRYLLNDYCVLNGKPFVYGSIFQFEGQVSVFDARTGPCYRCLFPEPVPVGMSPVSSESGVFGVLPGTIGTLEASEAIKLILGIGEPLIGKLALYDALDLSLQVIQLRKNPDCKICGTHPEITQLTDPEVFCGVSYNGVNVQDIDQALGISPETLKKKVENEHDYVLIDVRNPVELQVSSLEQARNIPMNVLLNRIHEYDHNTELILFCRTGARSLRAARWLLQAGYKNVKYLKGGINAWANQVDPTMLTY